MNEPPITLILAIDLQGDHISGCAHLQGGPAQPFEGRLGLMAVIENLLADVPTQATAHPENQERT